MSSTRYEEYEPPRISRSACFFSERPKRRVNRKLDYNAEKPFILPYKLIGKLDSPDMIRNTDPSVKEVRLTKDCTIDQINAIPEHVTTVKACQHTSSFLISMLPESIDTLILDDANTRESQTDNLPEHIKNVFISKNTPTYEITNIIRQKKTLGINSALRQYTIDHINSLKLKSAIYAENATRNVTARIQCQTVSFKGKLKLDAVYSANPSIKHAIIRPDTDTETIKALPGNLRSITFLPNTRAEQAKHTPSYISTATVLSGVSDEAASRIPCKYIHFDKKRSVESIKHIQRLANMNAKPNKKLELRSQRYGLFRKEPFISDEKKFKSSIWFR